MQKDRTYVCIDLKSFYASVECRERGLDPMTTNLVVADPERSDKTICLAVSPAMKKLGVPGRCRVFEIPKGIEYIMAPPRMQLYIDYSAEIYAIYLKYISKEDIHVYSIDEVFMDVTDYLAMYQMSAKELSVRIMEDILEHTGITATAGIGTNLYLAKVALDITAKHVEDHIGILDEESYCKTLWNHKPLTDFWRIGKGIANRLEQSGIRRMGEIAHADEDMLYRQVLECDYTFEKGKLVVKEMADLLCLELVEKGLVTDSITLHVGYSNRLEKKPAHGTIGLRNSTSSARQIIAATEKLYCQIVDPYTSVRRMTVTFNQVVDEQYQQYDLFTDPAELEREHRMQEAILDIKEKFGKNAILKGIDLQAGATTMERNRQIGGHKSGT